MSIFNFLKSSDSKKISDLEEKISSLSKEVVRLRGELKDTQVLVQHVASAHHGLASDMSTIYINLQEVMMALTEAPQSDPWGIDPEDPGPTGGGYLN
jgi:hypothetical protein